MHTISTDATETYSHLELGQPDSTEPFIIPDELMFLRAAGEKFFNFEVIEPSNFDKLRWTSQTLKYPIIFIEELSDESF